jgi:hypothetical protein
MREKRILGIPNSNTKTHCKIYYIEDLLYLDYQSDLNLLLCLNNKLDYQRI